MEYSINFDQELDKDLEIRHSVFRWLRNTYSNDELVRAHTALYEHISGNRAVPIPLNLRTFIPFLTLALLFGIPHGADLLDFDFTEAEALTNMHRQQRAMEVLMNFPEEKFEIIKVLFLDGMEICRAIECGLLL